MTLTWQGLHAYASHFVDGYEGMRDTVGRYLAGLDSDQGTDAEIVTATGLPKMLVRLLLHRLEDEGLLTLSKSQGPWLRFYGVSALLRRQFQ